MCSKLTQHLAEVTKHLYISPLELCNLNCQICYTAKTKSRLSTQAILNFIRRYASATELQTITFCGGEVFLMPDFPDLVNSLTPDYFIQIITNGTLDRLNMIQSPNMVNLIVSLDGSSHYHDLNRGQGMWQRSTQFMETAKRLGFHLEVFSIVTRENLPEIGRFEATLTETLGMKVPVTYHPRKPMTYLSAHPVSNRLGAVEGFQFLDAAEYHELSKTRAVFPPPKLGCYQFSLMSDGKVYPCCEAIKPLGPMTQNMDTLLSLFRKRVNTGQINPQSSCLGCVEPQFACGFGGTCPD